MKDLIKRILKEETDKSNRLPKGVEKPDHTYGNRLPVDKWIKVK